MVRAIIPWFSSALLAIAIGIAPGTFVSAQRTSSNIVITTLSSRPDMVSGGDALIEVRRGAAAQSARVVVTLNGNVVTNAFRVDTERGALVGLVEGLRNGANTITASAGGHRAQLQITNYPITGPIVSGPHLTPFMCRTEEAGLGPPQDANCSAPVRLEYFYRTTDVPPGAARGRGPAVAMAFKPLVSRVDRPADLASTTTTDGRRVPYIVRVESGTINRAIYRIAVLDDPVATSDAQPWRPGPGWNKRLIYTFGGGCGTNYMQGVIPVPAVLFDFALSRGFAHAVSTQTVMGLHCNDHLSGEALMMIKEHFIERYGPPVWTMGFGGSGGAIQQLLIAQNFPGLLDGLLPSMAYADSMTNRPATVDCRLLARVFAAAPEVWTAAKQTAVEGYSPGTCASWNTSYANNIVADHTPGCGIPPELVYHPTNNPRGARCTVWDTNVASFMRDPATGFARRTLDNVGVQYGLDALNRGIITPAEFMALNSKVGGFDNDGHVRDARSVADPVALRLAHTTGRVNTMRDLGAMPIIHVRPYLDRVGDIHSHDRDFTVRARLRAATGHTDNQIIWVFPALADQAPGAQLAGGSGSPNELSIETMRQWLDGIAADRSEAPATERVRRAKPPAAADACWDHELRRIDEPITPEGRGRCRALYPPHSTPRRAAGAPIADDVIKCQLKPIDLKEYSVALTPAQMRELQRVFPNGVCDYSKPGVGYQRPASAYLKLPLR